MPPMTTKKTIKPSKHQSLKDKLDMFDELVKAAIDKEPIIKKAEEAYSRKDYINNIETVVRGGATEFFKCRLVDKLLVQSEYRAHWEKEWRYHIVGQKMDDAVGHNISFAERRRRNALDEVLTTTRNNVRRYMTTAANTIAKYLDSSNSKMQKVLGNQDAADFIQVLADSFIALLEQEKQQ